jgi:hypothetical protein
MSTKSDFDRRASAWLGDGPTELHDRVLDAALREVHLTRQRRRRAPWRATLMSIRLGAAALIALVAVAGILAFNMIGGVGTPPTAPPSPSPVGATAVPTPTSAAVATLDPKTFATYTSPQYGFSIGHPTSWSETPATRAWSFATDSDATAPETSAGVEHFTSPDGKVRVSAWEIPLESSPNLDSRGELLSWISDYCTRSGSSGCAGIPYRAVPFCNERRDCHVAFLVPFDDWTGTFAWGGSFDGTVLVTAVWRTESAPEVAPYGGSRRLLEAFLSTINIVPATGDQLEGWPLPSPT